MVIFEIFNHFTWYHGTKYTNFDLALSVPLFDFVHLSFIHYQCTNFKFNTTGVTFHHLAGLCLALIF